MDTNQRNREAEGKRRPQQGTKPRPAAAEEPQARRKEIQKKTAAGQLAQDSASRQKRQEPRQRPAQQEPRQRQTAQRPRDSQSALQGGPHQRAAQQRTTQQRPAQQRSAGTANAGKRSQTKSKPKQNPVQKLLGMFRGSRKQSGDQETAARERRKKRAAEAERKRRQAERNNTPAVIYTAPRAFNRSRLIIQLITVTAVVVALVMGLSVFFKVKTITVAGAQTYSAWTVREASGIQEGDNLLTFSRGRAVAQIYAELSYVEKARIGIKLPDTVIIYIEEADVAYSIRSTDGTWWLMTSGGRVTEQIDSASAEKYTKVLGVTLENPEPGREAVAKEDVPTETDAAGEPVPVTVTGTQRLLSALQILKALEANDIVGSAASVDVSILDDIMLWYGTRYQVKLGDTTSMEYKIACMNDAILQLSDYQTGVLDISFTTWQDQVGYTPFT